MGIGIQLLQQVLRNQGDQKPKVKPVEAGTVDALLPQLDDAALMALKTLMASKIAAAGIPGSKAVSKPDSAFNAKQLRTGTKVEKEHTTDARVAKEIAKDHLSEFDDYYVALKKMEDNLKQQEKNSRWLVRQAIKA